MRKAAATFSNGVGSGVYRAVRADSLAGEWQPGLQFVVRALSEADKLSVTRLNDSGVGNVHWVESAALEAGDIITPRQSTEQAWVLYRESDVHHTLLLTNRCNSNCLMCSQPPTKHDDSWLVTEAIDVARHMRQPPKVLGLSGGEPLLLGGGLRRVLDEIAALHPLTHVEVLTNGRLFADSEFATSVLSGLQGEVSWLIPLYGHADFLHDFVVQAPGAFDETLNGLLAVQAHRQPIQLRVVLIEPVLRYLPELCGFIGRNLPFVREVALMACEPVGFALANREQCEVDLMDWAAQLEQSARILKRHQVPFLFMNAPLCALPESLRPDAHQSISDWKNVYAEECSACAAKARCSGLFAWHEHGWKPSRIRVFQESVA